MKTRIFLLRVSAIFLFIPIFFVVGCQHSQPVESPVTESEVTYKLFRNGIDHFVDAKEIGTVTGMLPFTPTGPPQAPKAQGLDCGCNPEFAGQEPYINMAWTGEDGERMDFSDFGVRFNRGYRYWVVAENEFGESEPVSFLDERQDYGKIYFAPFSVGPSLEVTKVDETSLAVKWSEIPGISSYAIVWKSASASGEEHIIVPNSENPSVVDEFTLSGLTPGTDYEIHVYGSLFVWQFAANFVQFSCNSQLVTARTLNGT